MKDTIINFVESILSISFMLFAVYALDSLKDTQYYSFALGFIYTVLLVAFAFSIFVLLFCYTAYFIKKTTGITEKDLEDKGDDD